MNALTAQFTCDECDLIKRDGVQLAAAGAKICSKCATKIVLHLASEHVEMIRSMIASRRPINGGSDAIRR